MIDPESAEMLPWRQETLARFPGDTELHTMFKQIWAEEDENLRNFNLRNNNKNMTYSEERELHELRQFKANFEREKAEKEEAERLEKAEEEKIAKMAPHDRNLYLAIKRDLLGK